ncbi:hypothetical protein H8S23_09265 [Anaerofilum sp. BX8]|uniref:Membrane biogenesis protein n=1 Tax=Anaerofilum hominis TaxID=2763016 RepID=A0A923I7G8_9FIRM|nr:BtpA/SgcQ family protein [Anaerofilum hominis]MBC5581695.1 hypothetical protein [Anaerofilum hominis]
MFPDDLCGPKAVIAALRLRDGSRKEKLDRCLREAEICADGGVDALLIAGDRFTAPEELASALELLRGAPCPLGVSAGGDFFKSWQLAQRFDAAFVLVSSVAGHLRREDDGAYADRLAACRAGSKIQVIGGVRFQQQPILSGRPWAEDLRLGMGRCDAVAVSGSGGGRETPTGKIRRFRAVAGAFPLVAAGGMTAATLGEKLAEADAVLVSGALRDTGRDSGRVDAGRVKAVMREAARLRDR